MLCVCVCVAVEASESMREIWKVGKANRNRRGIYSSTKFMTRVHSILRFLAPQVGGGAELRKDNSQTESIAKAIL